MVSFGQQERCKRPYQSSDCVDEGQQSAKRQRVRSNNYPPHVWDHLSVITLTRKALQEFDRRTAKEASASTTEVGRTDRRLLRSDARRLKQYAEEGGPDLDRLRGYASRLDKRDVMSRRQRRRSERSDDSGLPESSGTGATTTTSPYDAQFEQILIEEGVYPVGYEGSSNGPPDPNNLEEIQQRLARARPSLSPSRFDDAQFRDFRRDNLRAGSELDITTNVIPSILGGHDRRHHFTMNKPFTGMQKFHQDLTTPQPDKYYGAAPGQIDPRVRNDLSPYVVPGANMPAAPNNFFEFKGPSGRNDVLRRQATHDAAVGARAMWHLQNYGQATPSYDGNAYSTVSTYNDGQLRLYATHPRESATGQPEYHMTLLRSYAMTDTSYSFRQGAAAFRNARDMSRDQLNQFIADANAVARNHPVIASPTSTSGSRATISSAILEESAGSDTSFDELSLEYEQRLKRPRTGQHVPLSGDPRENVAPPRVQAGRSTSRAASASQSINARSLSKWGYLFELRSNGEYSFRCTIAGKRKTLRAKWVDGQQCPQVFDPKANEWKETLVEADMLRLYVRNHWATLGKG